MIDYREHAPNNLEPYNQGRSDQRAFDRIVAVIALALLAIYITFWE